MPVVVERRIDRQLVLDGHDLTGDSLLPGRERAPERMLRDRLAEAEARVVRTTEWYRGTACRERGLGCQGYLKSRKVTATGFSSMMRW
jgi:hypothetical protein